MKISRKMQRLVEMKIRHAMATGPLPIIERNSTSGTHPRHETDKSEGNGTSHSK